VPSGAETTIALEVELVSKRVALVASDAPVANTFVLVSREDSPLFFVSLSTDAEGVLEPRLAPGTYTLSIQHENGVRTTSLEWPLAGTSPRIDVDAD